MCINQSDDLEKGYRVGLTAKVYSQTECVLAWLGARNENTRAAVTIIKEVAESAAKFGLLEGSMIFEAGGLGEVSSNIKSYVVRFFDSVYISILALFYFQA